MLIHYNYYYFFNNLKANSPRFEESQTAARRESAAQK